MARRDLIQDAVRPKMHGRALFKGPQGSGKTWTMLSVAHYLAGDDGKVLVIDTERESALTYADVFRFRHLPWAPPYDTAELTKELEGLTSDYTGDDVVVIDSASHFWQGVGGILDVANGRVQGGWDKARPIQNRFVDQLLAMPCHVLLGARMKNTVQLSDNGKSVEAIGLTITQSEDMEYEFNVVVQMGLDHSGTVTKSRTQAVPVGRVFPAGHERKLAEEYAEWLAGGVPPANRGDVDRVVGTFAGITDKDRRSALKGEFIKEFGMPQSLAADRVAEALAWLEQNVESGGVGGGEDPDPATSSSGGEPSAPPNEDATAPPAGAQSEPENGTGGRTASDKPDLAVWRAEVNALDADALLVALDDRGLPVSGSQKDKRDRLFAAGPVEKASA